MIVSRRAIRSPACLEPRDSNGELPFFRVFHSTA
jgi:hypothetical protein